MMGVYDVWDRLPKSHNITYYALYLCMKYNIFVRIYVQNILYIVGAIQENISGHKVLAT